MEQKEEEGLAELLIQLFKRVEKLEEETRRLDTEWHRTLRSSDIDKVAAQVEQSLARKIGMQFRDRAAR